VKELFADFNYLNLFRISVLEFRVYFNQWVCELEPGSHFKPGTLLALFLPESKCSSFVCNSVINLHYKISPQRPISNLFPPGRGGCLEGRSPSNSSLP
jgi:hypothetical protein